MAEMDMASVGIQDQDNVSNSEAQSGSHVDTNVSEKMIPQSEVNRIMAHNREKLRNDYYNRGREEALAELERNKKVSDQPSSMGGVKQFSQDDIDQMIESRIKERENQLYGQRTAHDFVSKLEASKDKYPDFEQSVRRLNLAEMPPAIVIGANELDNCGDTMYHLSQNPMKYAAILTLAERSPELARLEMQKLSDSLKKNADAKGKQPVDAPLSQMKAIPVGKDNGKMSIRDLRRQSWMKA
jgi:hypothetical protein